MRVETWNFDLNKYEPFIEEKSVWGDKSTEVGTQFTEKITGLKNGGYYMVYLRGNSITGERDEDYYSFSVTFSGLSFDDFWNDAKNAGWIFPIPASEGGKFTHTQPFNAKRPSSTVVNRSHAGIDLMAVPGTVVVAMESGVVVDYHSDFFGGTGVAAIKHTDGTIARYTEMTPSVRVGDIVKQGDIIGKIIANNVYGTSMLHLECIMARIEAANQLIPEIF